MILKLFDTVNMSNGEMHNRSNGTVWDYEKQNYKE